MSFQGRFVWCDLLTTEPAAARRFYPAVTGWTVRADDGPDYTHWEGAKGPLAGMMDLPEQARAMGAPPHWLGYVAVPDVDEGVSRAVRMGGKLLSPPMDLPDVGRFCTIQDPQGASIALFHSTGGGVVGEPRDLGVFSWHELYTSDLDAAWSFHAELFGWVKTESMDMGPMGTYQMYGVPGGPTLGGMMKRPAEMPVSAWNHYVHVADLDMALAAVRAGGGQVINGPMEVPGGDRVASCTDPQGAMFSLHQTVPQG